MSENRGDNEEIEIPLAIGTARIKGYRTMDLVVLIGFASVVIGPFVGFYFHTLEVRQISTQHAEAIEKLAQSFRFNACINALPIEIRQKELQHGSYCDQMARLGLIPPN